MPITAPSAPTTRIDAFELGDRPHQQRLPYQPVNGVLDRALTLRSGPQSTIRGFRLRDLLEFLKIPTLALKGSSVFTYREPAPLQDIDLQIPAGDCMAADWPQQTLSNIRAFFQQQATKRGELLDSKTLDRLVRISRLASQDGNTWKRVVFSLGYGQPSPGHSSVDVTCSRDNTLGYDTLNASRALVIRRAECSVVQTDVISPPLLAWLNRHGYLWFNPQMEGGLRRLNYRLSKNDRSVCLQPAIFQHFLDKADPNELTDVLIHLLHTAVEVPGPRAEAMARIWRGLLNHLSTLQGEAQNTLAESITQGLLEWTGTADLMMLGNALESENNLAHVQHLHQACTRALNLRTDIRTWLQQHPTLARKAIRDHGQQAMRVELVQPADFFEALDSWVHLGDIPESELVQVLRPLAAHWQQHLQTEYQQRATHLLGWLDGDLPLGLLCWMDRIPTHRRRNPATEHTQALLPMLKAILEDGKLRQSLPAAIWDIAWPKVHLQELAEHIEQQVHSPRQAEFGRMPWNGLLITLIFHQRLGVLAEQMHQVVSNKNLACSDEMWFEAAFLHNMSTWSFQTLANQPLPPLLKHALVQQGNTYRLQLLDHAEPVVWSEDALRGQIKTSSTGAKVHFCLRDGPTWIHTTFPDKPNRRHRIFWSDQGQVSIQGREIHTSADQRLMTQMKHLTPTQREWLDKATPLIQQLTGHTPTPDNIVQAVGTVDEQAMLRARNPAEGLMALQQGEIWLLAGEKTPCFCIQIDQGKPSVCRVETRTGLFKVSHSYQVTSENTTPLQELSQPEHVGRLQTKGTLITTELPYLGGTQLQAAHCLREFDFEHQQFGDECLLLAQDGLRYAWQGKLNAAGALLHDGQLNIPGVLAQPLALRQQRDGHTMPMEAIPLMAEILETNPDIALQFKPHVHDADEGSPPHGFEGFVVNVGSAVMQFKGYFKANGRGVGHLYRLDRQGDIMMLSGGFLLRQPDEVHDMAGLEQTVMHASGLTIALVDHATQTPTGVLMPHGHCTIKTFPADRSKASLVRHELYFAGWRSALRGLENPVKPLDASGSLQHLLGTGRNGAGGLTLSVFVIHPTDGGPDYVTSFPLNFTQQTNCIHHFSNLNGFYAAWTMEKDICKHARLMWPNGLQLNCGIAQYGGYFKPDKMGNVQFNGLCVAFKMTADERITTLTPRDEPTKAWMMDKGISPQSVKGLPDLIARISNQQLDWETDCLPDLKIRELDAIKDQRRTFEA
ncbi:hypothetical protein NQT62_10815 [Limnobacter humi]|uniref:DUF4132 domain-containing protein n=1 Tax=Limnobacter humi TaxID=1778671 RepID=A0ABT1WHC5_9BURK|nr:hypothetical protein [Limnobacter humi]MCQ8896922.1 hypothetical protein [Limnobacter humi]